MKGFGFFILFTALLVGSWKLQEIDLLLGYTLGIVGLLGASIWFTDWLARKLL